HCRLACSRSDRRYREVEAIGADTLKESLASAQIDFYSSTWKYALTAIGQLLRISSCSCECLTHRTWTNSPWVSVPKGCFCILVFLGGVHKSRLFQNVIRHAGI